MNPTSDLPPHLAKLHTQWRGTNMALIVITSLRNGGHAKWGESMPNSWDVSKSSHPGALKDALKFLHAFHNVLIRDKEVFATTFTPRFDNLPQSPAEAPQHENEFSSAQERPSEANGSPNERQSGDGPDTTPNAASHSNGCLQHCTATCNPQRIFGKDFWGKKEKRDDGGRQVPFGSPAVAALAVKKKGDRKSRQAPPDNPDVAAPAVERRKKKKLPLSPDSADPAPAARGKRWLKKSLGIFSDGSATSATAEKKKVDKKSLPVPPDSPAAATNNSSLHGFSSTSGKPEIVKGGKVRGGIMFDRAPEEWRCLMLLWEPHSLMDHQATVLEYAKISKIIKTQGPQMIKKTEITQDVLLESFQKYILINSFPKMASRVGHWSSQGFLHCLGKLCDEGEEVFRGWFADYAKKRDQDPTFSPSHRTDSGLRPLVLGLSSVMGTENDITRRTPYSTESDLKMLIEAFDSPSATAYDRFRMDTFYQFHQLHVSASCNFWITVALFSHAAHGGKADLEDMKGLAKSLLHSANFMWQLVQSRIFQYYLDVLDSAGALKVPLLEDKGTILAHYMQYVETLPVSSLGRTFWSSTITKMQSEGSNKCDNEKEDGDIYDKMEEEDNQNAELAELLSSSDRTAFDEYSRLMVAPLSAAPVILGFPAPDELSVEIAEFLPLPDILEVEPWPITIRRVIDDDMSESLFSYVNQCLKIKDKTGGEGSTQGSCEMVKPERESKEDQPPMELHRYTMKLRRYLLGHGSWSFPGTIHCEAALAAQQSDEIITVSKRCCPVCWELLSQYKAKTRFGVRGCHCTLYSVELPHSLSEDMLRKTIEKWSSRLRDEIIAFCDEQNLKKPNQPSRRASSESLASYNSTNSAISTAATSSSDAYYIRY